jgi:putative transposase
VDGTPQAKRNTGAVSAAHSPGAILGWFRQMMPPEFFTDLKRDLEIIENSCVFALPVTVWLMILQRLSPVGTLESAVEQLRQGSGQELLEPCKQVREGRISGHTGAYGQARVNLPVEAARRIAEQTFRSLHPVGSAHTLHDRLFVLDGSTIRLAHSAGLVKAFPAARNPRRPSHWPILLVTVLHHVKTGTAMAPAFGPMHGPEAVSEQALAGELIDRLPSQSTLIGDRNFGIFAVLWRAHRQGHRVLTRLTADRAKRLAGGAVPEGDSDLDVVWEPSNHDRRAHPEIPVSARIEGRLMAVKPEGAKQILYLFTTREEPVDEVAALYGRRWTIETDLRSLKEQVRLHRIEAKSPGMVASELYLAVAAWNLIRAVMQEAARLAGVEPRRLSFFTSSSRPSGLRPV